MSCRVTFLTFFCGGCEGSVAREGVFQNIAELKFQTAHCFIFVCALMHVLLNFFLFDCYLFALDSKSYLLCHIHLNGVWVCFHCWKLLL